MLLEDMVGDRKLADVVQKTRSGEHSQLGRRHRHLASNLDAEVRYAPIVAERLPILDQVAEDDHGIQPSPDLRHRMCDHWDPPSREAYRNFSYRFLTERAVGQRSEGGS